ncbi:MAG: hypothetical protein ACNA7W_19490 [Pseudomonadales bacterium]
MTTRQRKALLLVAVLLLLLPLTLITALMLIVSYPAYAIPDPGALQIVFDVAMMFMVAAVIAGWRLSVGFLRRGRDGVGRAHGLWMLLLGIGALIGVVGAGFAIEHAINPRTAADHVGFALLSPAVLLLPVCLLLWRYRKR